MAERRMFTNKITEADEFTALPPTTQCLYFHLCMSADDDGFSNKIRNSMFAAHADSNDLDLLITKRFVIPFESGVVVIKHWRMHNLIRADRYHETDYLEEKARLLLKDNGSYTDRIPLDNQVTTTCQPNDNQMAPEVSIGKDSKGKDIKRSAAFVKPTLEQIKEYCQERRNNVDPEVFFDFYESKGWMVGKNKMKDWKACVRTWERSETRSKQPESNPKIHNYNERDYDFDELTKGIVT